MGYSCNCWTATESEKESTMAYSRNFRNDNLDIIRYNNYNKGASYSVRLIKDT